MPRTERVWGLTHKPLYFQEPGREDVEMGAFRASSGHGPGRLSYGFWAALFTNLAEWGPSTF